MCTGLSSVVVCGVLFVCVCGVILVCCSSSLRVGDMESCLMFLVRPDGLGVNIKAV